MSGALVKIVAALVLLLCPTLRAMEICVTPVAATVAVAARTGDDEPFWRVIKAYLRIVEKIGTEAFSVADLKLMLREGSSDWGALFRVSGQRAAAGEVNRLLAALREAALQVGERDRLQEQLLLHLEDELNRRTGRQQRQHRERWFADLQDTVRSTVETEVNNIQSIAFSPDGNRIAIGGSTRQVQVLDRFTREPMGDLRTVSQNIFRLRFSPDGHDLMVTLTGEATEVIDFENVSRLVRIAPISGDGGFPKGVSISTNWSPNGDLRLAVFGDSFLEQWEIEWADIESKGNKYSHIGIEPTRDRKWDLSIDSEGGYEIGNKKLGDFEVDWNPRRTRHVRFSNGGRWMGALRCNDSPEVAIWNTRTGRLMRYESRQGIVSIRTSYAAKDVKALHFFSDERRAFAANDQAPGYDGVIWDIETGDTLKEFKAPQDPDTRASATALSPSNGIIAVALNRPAVRLWDVRTGALIVELATGEKPSTAVAFSPDGRLLVVGDESGKLHFWQLPEEPVAP